MVPVRYFKDILPLFLQVGQGKGHRLVVILPIGVRKVCIEDGNLICSQDAQVNVGLNAKLVIKTVNGVELYGANLSPVFHLNTNAIGFLRIGRW